MDLTIIFALLIFVMWVYFIDLSLNSKHFGFSIAEFLLSLPLAIYIASSSYISSFVFGSSISLVIVLISVYVASINYIETRKTK